MYPYCCHTVWIFFFGIILHLIWQLDDIPLKLSLYSESNIIRSGAVSCRKWQKICYNNTTFAL